MTVTFWGSSALPCSNTSGAQLSLSPWKPCTELQHGCTRITAQHWLLHTFPFSPGLDRALVLWITTISEPPHSHPCLCYLPFLSWLQTRVLQAPLFACSHRHLSSLRQHWELGHHVYPSHRLQKFKRKKKKEREKLQAVHSGHLSLRINL